MKKNQISFSTSIRDIIPLQRWDISLKLKELKNYSIHSESKDSSSEGKISNGGTSSRYSLIPFTQAKWIGMEERQNTIMIILFLQECSIRFSSIWHPY